MGNPKKTKKNSKSKKTSSSVFDRLSNPTLFSGIHQHRFDPITGRGKGIAGRSLPSKGPGHVDKSQRVHVLLRPKKYKPPKKYVRNGDFVSKRLKNYNGVRDAAMKEVKNSDVGQMLVTKGEKIDQWLIETIGVAQTRTGKMSYQLENVKVW